MRLPRVVESISRRGARVLVLTALLVTVACCAGEGGPESTLAACIRVAVSGGSEACTVPTDIRSSGGTIRYVAAGDDCNSCDASCDFQQYSAADFFATCIPNCKFACPARR